MTLVKLIQIDAEPELLSYHGATPTDPRPFAVALSPAAEGDDEPAAKDYFRAVLAATADIRWYAYQLDPLAAPVKAIRVQAANAPILAPAYPDPALQAYLMTWLEARAAVLGGTFFVRPEAGAEVIEAGTASAGDTLRVAQGWDAPVPHTLGLMHLVKTLDFAPGQVLVPFFPGGAAPDEITGVTVVARDVDHLASFEADLFGDGTNFVCQTNVLRDPPAAAAIFPVDPDTGFLTANGDAADLRRTLQTIDAAGPTQFWTTPVLQGVVSNDGDADLSKDLATPGVLRWLAAAGAATALDPVLFALTMPGVDGSEGHLLAPLINLALAGIALEDEALPITALPRLTTLEDIKLRAAFKSAIAENPLVTGTGDTVAELRRLHGLPSDKNTEAATPDLTQLNVLLGDFQTGETGPMPTPGDPDRDQRLLATVTRALGDLTARLQEEAGAERAILAVLRPVFNRPDGGFAPVQTAIETEAGWSLDDPQKGALAKALSSTWLSFERTLEGAFDGAEAVRRSVGHVLQAALLGAVPKPLKLAEVAANLKAQLYFSSRVLPVPSQGTDLGLMALAESLWRPALTAPEWLTPAQVTQLTEALDDAYEALAETLMPTLLQVPPEELRLMTPDQAPGPLSIQIADDLDPKTLEEFDQVFNGIGVLVQRRFNNADTDTTWAHANLVELFHTPDEVTRIQISGAAVRPFFPALVDNRRALFLDFTGFPMATPAFDETRTRQDVPTDAAVKERELVLRRPFHLADDIQAAGFAGVPRLAYGAAFQTAAFAVTNGGTLPPAVTEAANPILPKAPGNAPDLLDPAFRGQAIYRRRTAIGRVALTVADDYLMAKSVVAAVQPLSADYPRQSLGSRAQHKATLDIFRNTDGQGAITLGADDSAALALRDLEWWGGEGTLTVEVMQMSRSGTPPRPHPVAVPYAAADGGQLAYAASRNASGLEITVTKAGVSLNQHGAETNHAFDDPLPPGPFWLRLTLQAGAGSASISFDDTLKADDPGNFYARPEPASRILMAPDDTSWVPQISGAKTLTLGFPRVGFMDFERWCANPYLPGPAGLIEAVEDALMVAYLMRGSTAQSAPRPGAARVLSIAELLERLPDPAVRKLEVTLLPEDRLGAPAAVADSKTLDVPAMPIPGSFDSDNEAEPEIKYREYLTKLDDALYATIEVSVGTAFTLEKTGDTALRVTLPKGMVARLQVRPLVEAASCTDGATQERPHAAFDAGIAARALGQAVYGGTEYLIFPGPDMVVETLTDALSGQENTLRALIPRMVLCDPSGPDRAYSLRLTRDLPAAIDQANLWRSLSHIDIETQQWRFSGRPIYNWPRLEGEGPVVQLGSKDEAILDFEKEAFFDRDNADAGKLTKRIEPLAPNGTAPPDTKGVELQRLVWDAPTATMFRHRFILRSRYAAAMVNGVREVSSWSKDPAADPAADPALGKLWTVWTYRVAIRASLSRIEVNRPQLRALLPLTAPAGRFSDAQRPSPPILAVLEEKPFVDGGLADRVLGMIHTGVHFGYPNLLHTDPKWVVQPRDTRKEIGPNPRMALRPLSAETALAATLSHEGPMGLSFDADTATTPAWANSQHIFTPRRLGRTPSELPGEMHMGVSLIRVLEPDWCDAPPVEDTSTLSARRSWLMTFGPLPAAGQAVLSVGGQPIFRTGGGTRRTLQIWNKALDAYADAGAWSDLAEVDQSDGQAISLLHQSLGEGRFRATLLQAPKPADNSEDRERAIALGCDSTFRVLASLPWSMPGEDAGEGLATPTLSPLHVASVSPVAASAPTDMRWIKTIGDNTMIEVAKHTGARQTAPMPLQAIRAEQTKSKTLSFFDEDETKLWLRGKIGTSNVPNATHRHLAAIFTQRLPGPGRPIEVFAGSTLMAGRAISLVDAVADVIETGRVSVRFLAFETPARPVAANSLDNDAIRPELRQAYFDRVAATAKPDPAEARLKICLVRSDPANKRLATVTLRLRDANVCYPLNPLRVDETGASGLFLDTIDLTLRRQVDHYEAHAVPIFSDGTEGTEEFLGQAFGASLGDGFELALDVVDARGEPINEFWADVSCLFSETKRDGFNFDWVFSPSTHDRDVEFETKPDALKKMTEAQALVQFVSLSISVKGLQA